MQRELKLRILSGVVMAAVALAATWTGGAIFQIMSVMIGLLVYYEWSTITRLEKADSQGNRFGWIIQAVISLQILLGGLEWALPLLALFVVLAVLWVILRRRGSWWLPGGIVYAGLTAITLSAIRGDDALGLWAMIFLFSVVWATDIMAYVFGRSIGGPKLAPYISPGKTWSGAICGTVCGILAGTMVFWSHFSIQGARVPLLALCLSVSGQIGDLFESYIKRRFGVKDSSKLIPGHGGVMDRVDGLVFACFAALAVTVLEITVSGRQESSLAAVLLGL